MNHERFLDLCAAHALNILEPADRREFEQHLETGCAECEAMLNELQTGAEYLATSAAPARPSPELKQRVMAAVAPQRSSQRRFILAAVAAAALIAIAFSLFFDQTKPQILDLKPTPDGAANLIARVEYRAEDGSARVTLQNFKAPAARAYELWTLRDKGPESLGVINTDADGRAVIELRDLGALNGFAVSLEQEGGAPAGSGPQGPVVAAGVLP